MRLHQLKIKNLASLRGEHTVDFDVLSGQDLFAITGETGAGKSTLLNAISLALYGKIYKRQLIQSDIVSLGERDASIDLIFSVRGHKHLAKWSTTVRKKNGDPLSNPRTERFFYQLFDDAEPRVLDSNPEQILSMDFDQFSKCVILNQGEFARFLTASFSERRDILERLYPSDNLEAVGGIARKKWESNQEKLQRLDVQVHSLKEETLFDVEAAKQQIKKYEDSHLLSSEKLKKLRPWSQGIEELKTFSQKHLEAQSRLLQSQEILKEKTNENNAAMSKWREHHDELKKFEAAFEKERPKLESDDLEAQAITLQETKLSEKTRQLEEKRVREGTFRKRLESLSLDLDQSKKKLSLLNDMRQWPQLSDTNQIDWATWESLERNIPLKGQEIKSIKEQMENITETGKELAREESTFKNSIEKNLALMPDSWKRLTTSERTSLLREMSINLTRQKMHKEESEKIHKELSPLKSEIQELVPKLESLRLKIENQKLREAIEVLKSHPHSDKECPYCLQAIPSTQLGIMKTEWSKPSEPLESEILKKLEMKYQKTEIQIQSLEKRLSEIKIDDSFDETELKKLDSLHEAITLSENQRDQIQKRLESSRLQWSKLQEKLIPLQKSLEELSLQRSLQLKGLSKIVQVEVVWSESLYSQLLKEKENLKDIATQKQTIDKLQAQKDEILLDLKRLEDEVSQLAKEVSELKSDTENRKKVILQSYPSLSPSIILKGKLDQWRDFTAKDQLLQQEHRQKESTLSESRSNLGRIQEQLQQLELMFAELLSRMNQTRKIEVQIQEATHVLSPLLNEVNLEIEKENELLLSVTSELGRLKTLLQEDEKRQEKKAIFENEQKKAQQEANRWKRLLDVLGQDDMRTYVLSLVESALIQQTNVELQKLCSGRYEIQHNSRKGKLVPEFWIIDRWRDGLIRKVSTLSGGETFMVSLAMALALAEMARGRADIESFFIDEGFGTLDEDSLEDVMEMLQQVRSRGKQIGLITHVKSLSTRLPMNLRLKKDSKGSSTIDVVWN
ncbi:MAG: SMC family ATPase [Bacteriovoracaceae bacterium]|nr:SMC family ATPase [Bacteriovoracaceae bacterium]